MEEKFYTIDFKSHHIAYAIEVNNILIENNRFHEDPGRTIKANEWIYNGKNSYEINLSINPTWEKELEDNNFRLKIIEHKGSNGNYNSNELINHEWYYKEGTQFPVLLNGEFTVDIPFGNWFWLDADTLNEDTLDKKSLKNYILQLYKCLSDKDYSKLEPFLAVKSSELAKAYYFDTNDNSNKQKTFFTDELFNNPAWGMKDIDFENLFFRYHADYRLLEVLNKEGKSPLQSASLDGYTFSIELFLCHKNNQWILCR